MLKVEESVSAAVLIVLNFDLLQLQIILILFQFDTNLVDKT